MTDFRAPSMDTVRIGLIGVGHRGSGALARLCKIESARIVAVSDLYADRAEKGAKIITDAGCAAPKLFSGSEDSWRGLCESGEVDLVYVTTPWLCHTPMAVYAMRCGKHAVTEVPSAMTIEQCWQLVDTAEETRRHFMMLENCCYGENELFAYNLCHQGVLGELVHGEAAYIHDLRQSKLNPESSGGYQGQWRLAWTQSHNGNPYPTHGLGPICRDMDINRGDRLMSLVSMSSAALGLSRFAAQKFGSGSRAAKTAYRQGDMNCSIIRTYRGRTILVQHDTTSPRPYTRLNTISGTKGILQDYPLRVALEPNAHSWLPDNELADLKQRYGHELWREMGNIAKKNGGHGGMDFLMDYRLIKCLREGLPLDMSVYDAATWCSLVELTETSVAKDGASVEIPDFTRSGWKRD